MNFTVTYRAKNGALATETIDAADRAAAIAACRARGIVPTAVTQGGRAKSSPSRSPAWVKGVMAGVLVIAMAGGVWWWMSGRDDTRPPSEKPKKVKVAKPQKPDRKPVASPEPAPAPETNVVRKVVPKGTPMSERTPPKTYRDERGILRYEGGMRARDPQRPHHVAKRLGPDPLNDPVFKTRSENEIAMLLTATPGDMILSIRRYDEAFEADFKKALEHDLEVTEDDTPARAELKRAMAETKKELAARIKAGEKLGDILEETRSELRRLADYRRNIEKMVSETTRNPEHTDQEVADFIAAANKMLTDNGMKPIKSGIMRKNLLMRARKAQAADQQNTQNK